MLPKGLFGAVTTRTEQIASVRRYVESHLSDEEEFRSVASSDGTCILGYIGSLIVEYPAIVSEDETGESIGVRDGFFYDPSRLETSPHRLFDPDLRLPDEANGMFLCAAWNGTTLRILTDPLATIPLYYRSANGCAVFSTSLELVVDFPFLPPPQKSPEGWAQFLCFSMVFGGFTVFDGINRLKPAEILEWQPGGEFHSTGRYWDPVFESKRSPKDLKAVADAFMESVKKTVANAVPPMCLSLSGGFDSRSSLSAMLAMNMRPTIITHAIAEGGDVMISRSISAAFGLDHRLTWIGSEDFVNDFADYLALMLHGSSSMLPATFAHLPYLYRRYKPLVGSLLDSVTTQMEDSYSVRRRTVRSTGRDELCEMLWDSLQIGSFVSLLESEERKRIIETARNALFLLTPDPKDYAHPSEAADRFQFLVRHSCDSTDSMALQHHYNRCLAPYYELNYVKALLQLEGTARSQQRWQYLLIARNASRLLDFPRTHGGIVIRSKGNYYLRLLPVARQRLLVRFGKALPRTIRRFFDRDNPTLTWVQLYRTALRPAIEALLNEQQTFDSAKVQAYVQDFFSGTHSNAIGVSRLLALVSEHSLFHRIGKASYLM